jgi:hypothetical protein
VSGRIRLKRYLERAIANPRWMLMDSVSRFHLVRRIATRLGARPVAPRSSTMRSRLKPIDVDAFLQGLRVDGYRTGLALPPATVHEVLRFAHELPCFGDADGSLGFRYRDKAAAERRSGRLFSQASYLNRDGLQPVLDGIANDPLLLSIAERYLLAPPVITGTRMWWTFPATETTFDHSLTTSFFHYDKDDYAALRLFFYVTEVDAGRGPHVVLRGSHRRKALAQLVSLRERSDAELVAFYGSDHVDTLHGAAGEGFAEDPYCFHKATRPENGDRLMIEIKYARHDYRSFPAIDRSTLRLIPV